MKKNLITVTSAFALLFASVASSELIDRLRNLQSLPANNTVPRGRKRLNGSLESYPSDITIDYSVNLKCGACISGNYIYCVNGKEGDADLATKP